MNTPLTSDALFDTMPANTSFQMLSRFSLAGSPLHDDLAGGLGCELLASSLIDHHPSSFAPYLMRGSR